MNVFLAVIQRPTAERDLVDSFTVARLMVLFDAEMDAWTSTLEAPLLTYPKERLLKTPDQVYPAATVTFIHVPPVGSYLIPKGILDVELDKEAGVRPNIVKTPCSLRTHEQSAAATELGFPASFELSNIETTDQVRSPGEIGLVLDLIRTAYLGLETVVL